MLKSGSWSLPQTNSIRKKLRVKGAPASTGSISGKTNVKEWVIGQKNYYLLDKPLSSLLFA